MSKGQRKPYSQMTTAELREATKDLDREVPGVRGRPLTATEKKMHRDAATAAKKKMGRPPKGEGAEVVAVSIERGLLKRADALGKHRKLGRSALFTEALRSLLGDKATAGQIPFPKPKPPVAQATERRAKAG